jgi:hypothetical protein
MRRRMGHAGRRTYHRVVRRIRRRTGRRMCRRIRRTGRFRGTRRKPVCRTRTTNMTPRGFTQTQWDEQQAAFAKAYADVRKERDGFEALLNVAIALADDLLKERDALLARLNINPTEPRPPVHPAPGDWPEEQSYGTETENTKAAPEGVGEARPDANHHPTR